MKKIIDFLRANPLITGVTGIIMGFFVLRILGTGGNSDLLSMGLLRFAVAMIEIVFLVLISGGKTFDKCCNTTGYIFRRVIPIFVFVFIFVGIGTVVDITSGQPLASNWPMQILLSAFLCLIVLSVTPCALLEKMKLSKASSIERDELMLILAIFSDPLIR